MDNTSPKGVKKNKVTKKIKENNVNNSEELDINLEKGKVEDNLNKKDE